MKHLVVLGLMATLVSIGFLAGLVTTRHAAEEEAQRSVEVLIRQADQLADAIKVLEAICQ